MSPSDVVGTGVVGSVQATNRSPAVGVGQVGSKWSSPLDDFLRQERATAQAREQPVPQAAPVSEPRFGRIAFSAGVGGVLIELQSLRPLTAEAAGSEAPQVIAAYAQAQSLSDALSHRSTLERQMRAVTVERSGFWGRPATIDLLPMMV